VALWIVGVSALLVSDWLGGEMVYVHKVDVANATGVSSSEVKRNMRAA
jgi:uncharacterized membrane protein